MFYYKNHKFNDCFLVVLFFKLCFVIYLDRLLGCWRLFFFKGGFVGLDRCWCLFWIG